MTRGGEAERGPSTMQLQFVNGVNADVQTGSDKTWQIFRQLLPGETQVNEHDYLPRRWIEPCFSFLSFRIRRRWPKRPLISLLVSAADKNYIVVLHRVGACRGYIRPGSFLVCSKLKFIDAHVALSLAWGVVTHSSPLPSLSLFFVDFFIFLQITQEKIFDIYFIRIS